MRVPFALSAGLTLLAILFAGCVGGDDAIEEPPEIQVDECVGDGFCGAEAVVDEAGRDLRTELTAEDTLDAPTWDVGDVFEQHLYYGSSDTAGEHIQTMVVDDSGSCYQFGTTSQLAARNEVTFDLPVLGCVGKDNLQTSSFGTTWDWMYDFPLSDGKTWSGGVNGIFNWNRNSFHSYEFELTATYEAEIDTPKGNFPGFEISGITTEGEEFLRYNYVPAVGWFSHFWMYDLSTEDAGDIMFHAMSMGTSKGYTGPYYIDQAETAVETFLLVPFADGAPQPQFTVPDDATYMVGVIAPIACPGVSKVILNSPSNQQEQFDHTYEGDPQACTEGGDNPNPAAYTPYWIDRPAEPGDWSFAAVGAGVFGYFVWIEAITEHAFELTAADLPSEE